MADSSGNSWRIHPDRARLLAEAHARPYAPLEPPVLATRIATVSGQDGATADRAHMTDLCRRLGQSAPGARANWWALEADGWRLRWERHTEFSTWTFFRAPDEPALFATTGFAFAPTDWVEQLPGDVLVAVTLELREKGAIAEPLSGFPADTVGARVSGGAGSVYTDFRADSVGLTRFLLIADGADAALCGRLAQSLFEIETYRMMALLAFPLAGEAASEVARIEDAASALAGQLADDAEPEKDRALLGRLAGLAGETEALSARTAFRFGAGRAYHDIVRDRIASLREERIAGLQTLGEFMERRLAPAMRTCDSVAAREVAAIERIARTEQMLNTRVQVASEAASVALLASMDRRAMAQLRLQRTVEGLSVAAISYYAVGLLFYPLKALEKVIRGFDATIATGVIAPFVVITVWLLLRRLKRTLDEDGD